MFGSIYVGLSGLTAYSRGLQQVSNNVSNLNSSGFKSATVSFTDIVAHDGRGGLAYTGGHGGDYGNGVSIGEARTDFRPGDLRQTERDLDLAVDGSGFMMLMRGEELFYTRTGSFEVDPQGFIVLAGTQYRLATLDASGRPVSLSIDPLRTSAPAMTSTVTFADNLSSEATTLSVSGIKVYDANGGQHVWQARFARSATALNEWTVTVTDDKAREIGTATVRFVDGKVEAATAKPVFADAGNGLSVTFDLSSNVTSFSSGTVSTLRAAVVDGHGSGAATTIAVNEKGRLEISYSNEEKVDLGAVAIADFRDPTALEQRGGGLFVQTGQSARELMTSEDQRVGRVLSRRLEASNVDLARQFGDLILIQRGFQASSQIISVTNDMIQQLFGIRGQG
ncbi:MAG: flagellar hook protein FlgE [Sphingomonadales bacterium]|jgi:flagellar hook protein FlgE|nr:flagellar hook protein FlgE [Sphingomonadales bacterium]